MPGSQTLMLLPMFHMLVAAEEKKLKYGSAPCTICRDAGMFLHHLADRLSIGWGRPYSVVLGWLLRACLGFLLLFMQHMYVQGPCAIGENGIGIDGAGLPGVSLSSC